MKAMISKSIQPIMAKVLSNSNKIVYTNISKFTDNFKEKEQAAEKVYMNKEESIHYFL